VNIEPKLPKNRLLKYHLFGCKFPNVQVSAMINDAFSLLLGLEFGRRQYSCPLGKVLPRHPTRITYNRVQQLKINALPANNMYKKQQTLFNAKAINDYIRKSLFSKLFSSIFLLILVIATLSVKIDRKICIITINKNYFKTFASSETSLQ